MTKFTFLAAALALLASCGSSKTPAPVVSAEKVAACWQDAGLEGDLYQVYRPERFGIITSAGNASQAQLDQFNGCVGFPV